MAQQAAQRGFKRLALTGTRWLVESEVYPQALQALGIACARPKPEEREEINCTIMDELVCGGFRPQAVAYFQQVLQRAF